MTTVLADIVNASVTGNPVNVRGLRVVEDIGGIANTLIFDSSANATGAQTTLAFQGGAVEFPFGGTMADPNVDNIFDMVTINNSKIVANKLQVNRIPPVFSKVINPKISFGTSNMQLSSNTVTALTTTNIKLNTTDNVPITITYPNVTGNLIGTSSANTYTTQQNFSGGIKTNDITSNGTNAAIVLSGNGTGSVVCNATQLQNQITAKTINSSLSLSGNGTGTVAFDANGMKFSNGLGVLKDYSVGSFNTTITCGTFSSGSIAIKYQRIGNKITLRVPIVLGTPNVDTVWTGSIPVAFQPSVTQLRVAGTGSKNGLIPGIIFSKFTGSSPNWTISFNDDVSGFGNSGSCGWPLAWSVSYLVN